MVDVPGLILAPVGFHGLPSSAAAAQQLSLFERERCFLPAASRGPALHNRGHSVEGRLTRSSLNYCFTRRPGFGKVDDQSSRLKSSCTSWRRRDFYVHRLHKFTSCEQFNLLTSQLDGGDT